MDSINLIASIETQTSAHVEKPWLNEKGHAVSDHDLKELSKSWDQETWEKYLNSLDGTLSDQQLKPYEYDYLAENAELTCWDLSQSSADDQAKDFVADLLKLLTPQQQRIIQMNFWEGRSERYIAEELRVSRNTVKTLKKRVLRKLARHLKVVSPISPLVKGEENSSITKGGTDEGNHRLACRHLAEAG
jgi:RNA polymerase sigma factor (sigma-70 family)